MGNERGQALLLVVTALGLVLIAALGFAVDGAQYYTNRTMAQAAADAAAEAGIMSIYDGTNTSGTAAFSTGSSFTCTTTDARTPCVYARLNGFGGTADDTVTVDFNPTATAPGVSLSGADPTNLIRVTIARNIQTSFMRLLGTNTATIKAAGTAAIVVSSSSIPIIVTHPTLSGAFAMNGGPTITICGGANRSVQVNSSSSTSITVGNNPSVDLSHAGKDDDGNCNTGTGGDFADWGGPSAFPGTLLLGTRPGRYIQPASPLRDPLASISQPSVPGTTGTTVALPQTNLNAIPCGCPALQDCTLYMPGNYSSGITVQSTWALFAPGIYYISSGGFNMQSNSAASMAVTSCPLITTTVPDPNTGNGMMVFNTGNGNGDLFSFSSNAGTKGSIDLVGSDSGSTYKGILFFEDRSAGAHTGVGGNKGHSLQGGASITLHGTIYITNSRATMISTPGQYQNLSIQGNPSGTTTVIGEIIVSSLSLGGNGAIRMRLPPDTVTVREVALVK